MITKFATVTSIIAFAFTGAVAQAKVYDASESEIGVKLKRIFGIAVFLEFRQI